MQRGTVQVIRKCARALLCVAQRVHMQEAAETSDAVGEEPNVEGEADVAEVSVRRSGWFLP